MLISQIIHMFDGHRFDLHDEKNTQVHIGEMLSKTGLIVIPEYRLDDKNVVDFFIKTIAIEVKIKTQYSKKAIYRQCERYLKFESVSSLILITGQSLGFPKEINGKHCFVINLSKAWL